MQDTEERRLRRIIDSRGELIATLTAERDRYLERIDRLERDLAETKKRLREMLK